MMSENFIKPINDYSKEELLNIDNFYNGEIFHSLVIVPTSETHDSGFRCLKFIFVDTNQNIVGALGGGADVVHINGINGYGWTLDNEFLPKMVPAYAWRIDCLNRSGCLRLFCDKPLVVKHYIGTSDFILYVDDTTKDGDAE